MTNVFFENLESRSMLSATVVAAHLLFQVPSGPAITAAAVKIPSLVGRYRGSLNIAGVHGKSIVLNISKQLLNGSFTGKITSGGVSATATGVMKANKTFTIAFKGSHTGGAINGTGTGKLVGTKITISAKFNQGGHLYPGTVSATKF